jgi:hypothetical protein
MSENSYDNSYDSTYDADVYGYDEPMVGPLDAPEKPSGRHPVNIGQLVMGVAFAGMVLVWALVQGDVVKTDELRWLMPIPWIAAGAAGLAAIVWPGRRA